MSTYKAKEYRDRILLEMDRDIAEVIVKAIDRSNHKTLQDVEEVIEKLDYFRTDGTTQWIDKHDLLTDLKDIKL